MFCKNCGNEIKEGEQFCTNCGAKLTSDNENVNSAAESESVENADMGSASSGVESFGSAAGEYKNTEDAGAYNQSVNFDDSKMRSGAAHMGVSFGEAISLFFKNYANFNGRASRSEYWWAFLFNFIVSCAASLLANSVPAITGLVTLAFLLPGLSVYVRRLHDTGRHWHRILIGLIPIAGAIIMIVDMCKESQGDNKWGYGPNHF